jgi:hypothetical protein
MAQLDNGKTQSLTFSMHNLLGTLEVFYTMEMGFQA